MLLNALFECYVVSRTFECRGSLLWTMADQLFIYTFFFYKNVVFPAQAEYSYFYADFRLKIFFYYS